MQHSLVLVAKIGELPIYVDSLAFLVLVIGLAIVAYARSTKS